MLPVAFDNQGGLAWTEQSCRFCTRVVTFVIVIVMFLLLFLKQKSHVVGKVGMDLCDWINPSPG